MKDTNHRYETIVIGGGQAGLSMGYHLARHGLPFTILDASKRIGDSWRERWDSLRLFTPAKYNGLDGMPFPGPSSYFPTKDEVADYLEAYAAHFQLPVRNGVKVDRLSRNGERFVITAGSQRFEANQVVVAMANYQKPRVPDFAAELDASIIQMHSSEYRNPSQLQEGEVLIVGVGNSGAEIAKEIGTEFPTWVSGRSTGEIPFRIETAAARALFMPLVLRVLFHRLLSVATPIGRKARPDIISHGGPLVRVKSRDLKALGIQRVPRTVGVRGGLPLLDDGRVLKVANVVWCTGFHPGFSWIDLPIFGGKKDAKEPVHEQGIVPGQPGLYFVGLLFLYAMTSSLLQGVGRDAERIAKAILNRSRAG